MQVLFQEISPNFYGTAAKSPCGRAYTVMTTYLSGTKAAFLQLLASPLFKKSAPRPDLVPKL